MQPCTPKGQGSLFDIGCTKAEGVRAAQHGGGSCWESGVAGQSSWEHALGGRWQDCCRRRVDGPHSSQSRGVQRQVKGHKGACCSRCTKPEGRGRGWGRLIEPMEVSKDTTDETMEGGGFVIYEPQCSLLSTSWSLILLLLSGQQWDSNKKKKKKKKMGKKKKKKQKKKEKKKRRKKNFIQNAHNTYLGVELKRTETDAKLSDLVRRCSYTKHSDVCAQ
eukprot:405583-Pelagomonas_calceolata.AAC.2